MILSFALLVTEIARAGRLHPTEIANALVAPRSLPAFQKRLPLAKPSIRARSLPVLNDEASDYPPVDVPAAHGKVDISEQFQLHGSHIKTLGEPETQRERDQQGIIQKLMWRVKLEYELDEIEAEYLEMCQSGKGAAAAFVEYEEKKEQLEEELEVFTAKETEAIEMLQYVKDLTTKVEEARLTASTASSQLVEMQLQCKELDEELKNKAAEKEPVDAARATCEQELARLPQEVARASEALAASERAAADGLTRLKQVEAELDDLRTRESAAQVQEAKVAKELEEGLATSASIQDNTKIVEAKLHSLREELEQKEGNAAKLKLRVAEVEAEVAQASEAIATSETAAADTLTKLEKNEEELVELRTHETAAEVQEAKLAKELEEGLATSSSIRDHTKTIEAKLHSLRKELKQEKSGAADSKLRVAGVEAETKGLPDAIKKASARHNKWNARLEKLQSSIGPSREKLAGATAEMGETKKAYAVAQKSARGARMELRQVRSEKERLEEQARAFEEATAAETAQAGEVRREAEELTLAVADLKRRREKSKALLEDAMTTAETFNNTDASKTLETMALASLSGRDIEEKVAFSGRSLELAAEEAQVQFKVLHNYQERVQEVLDNAAKQRAAAQEQLEAMAAARASQSEQLRGSLDAMAKELKELELSVMLGLDRTKESSSMQLEMLELEANRMRNLNTARGEQFEAVISELKEKADHTKVALKDKSFAEEERALQRRLEQLRKRRLGKLAATSSQQQSFEKTAASAANGLRNLFSAAFQGSGNEQHEQEHENKHKKAKNDREPVIIE